MLNFYFKRPIVNDYVISGIIVFIARYLLCHNYLTIPKADRLFSTVSDMSTLALTMAGFILTLTTVLISFKSTNKIDRNNIQESDKTFDLFFASKLYFDTIQILNNAIKSLSIIALLGYILKLTLSESFLSTLYLYCVLGIIVIILTVMRCVLILTTILKMQKEK
jgi:magnesium-transporting ATPase (P-type)